MKERSPRFPFVPLRAALGHLTKINEAASGEAITRPDAIKALGYDKPNGKLHRVFAALRGYGLIEVKEKGVFTVAPLGKRLLQAPDSTANGPWLKSAREAALNPPMFRRIWNKSRHMAREQLEEALLLRGFTDIGAERAAEVFSRNRKFTKLDDLPEAQQATAGDCADKRGPGWRKRQQDGRGPGGRAAAMAAAAVGGPATAAATRPPGPPRDAVVLPLGKKRAIIPTGISQADYDLLLETLALWKGRIVAG